MITNDVVIKNASLTNSLNMTGLKMANCAIEINREVLLSNYTPEILSTTWSVLCQFIAKNYHQGKGTYIKGFGTFTFDNYKVDLEGTTNQFIRDKKLRSPVFIVSSEFNENIKPGHYTENGIIYYNQKQNNSVNHVKLNFSEISYAISISKEETSTIINHLINHLSESIRMNNFKNKVMPDVGELILNRNILGVKFNEDLIIQSRTQTQRYNFVKKNMLLNMDVSSAQNTMANNLTNPYKSIEKLRPAVSVLTKIEPSVDEYMRKQIGINIKKIPKHEIQNISRPFSQSGSIPINFINDSTKKVYIFKLKLNHLNLPNDLLESFEYFKGIIISNMKKYDQEGIGSINKAHCIDAIIEANIHPKMTKELCKNIVHIYNKGAKHVEYMKFITNLLKDCKHTLNKTNTIQPYFHLPQEDKKLAKSIINKDKYNISLVNKDILASPKHSNIIHNKKTEINNVKKEIQLVEALIPKLTIQYRNSLEQNISYNEFMNILSQYNIAFPKEKIIQILNFLDIPNINAFSLNNLIFCFKNTKIVKADSLISSKHEKSLGDDIITIYLKVKDIIYLKGGFNFLFQNNKMQLTKNDFILKLKSPVSPYEEETLSCLYDYIVKTNRMLTVNDFHIHFASNEIKFDSNFENKAIHTIIQEIEKKHLKMEQYFDNLLKYNTNTNNKVISRNDFISIMQKEQYKFSALELDYIFTYLDVKKDNVLDKEEFMSKINHEQLPLTKIQAIIKKHNIDIEDLAHRMNIDINIPNQKYTFDMFKDKIKKIDNTLSDEFILSMFNSLKNKESDNFIYSHSLLDALNFSRKEHLRNIAEGKPSNYIPSFKQHYISTIRKAISYQEMKKHLENADNTCCGLLTPDEYTRVFRKAIPQFGDEEHIKYARISNMCDDNKNLKYPQWLNLIFYDEKNDNFNLIVNAIINDLQGRFNGNIDLLIKHISKSSQGITTDEMKHFLINELSIKNVQMKTLTKLDVDANGIISSQDLNSILKRYQKTAFFKYDNKSELPNINLYPSETLDSNKVKLIVKKIKHYMKLNNINEGCLFKMIDKNNDGFISNPDFNETIDTILPLPPSIKDQLFNYLDYYHNGLIDLETFEYRFKDYDSSNTLALNKNSVERKILSAFSEFILKNKMLNDIEIFNLIDKDNDGIINIDDLKNFAEHILEQDKRELLNIKLDRVLETLSLTKNKHVGLNDLKIYMDEIKGKENKDRKYTTINECDILKTTTNQNLYPNKLNVDWINSVIERFGLFISEEYDSIKEFMYNNTEDHSEKFTFNDFLRFHNNNYKFFKDGFNLTKDELLAVFTSLDSQKKKYLTQNDLENKLQIFDYYKKMHNDIKRFLSDNFNSGVDAFKIFIKPKSFEDKEQFVKSPSSKNSITHKEFFDAINYFFPKKYTSNTILKYISKYFNGSNQEITFIHFNYLYYDSIKSNHHFLKNKFNDIKLINKNFYLSKSQSNFFSPKHKFSYTSFDTDPLLKIKRLIHLCKYDLDSIFLTAKALSKDGKHLNKFQFRNLIKQLNLGFTNVEIDYIMKKSGLTFDGFINLNDFIIYLKNQDPLLYKAFQNSTHIVGEIKQMIYKYYSNPLLCFQNSIKIGSIKLDFETFKNIITDMYKKEQRQQPNFTQIKTAFDVIDLRKDGMIDLNEWTKSFGFISGNLDINENNLNIPNGNIFDDNYKSNKMSMSQEIKNRKILREWESSSDVKDIYKIILKHKKIIKKHLKKTYFMETNEMLVQSDNLVTILKEFLPEMKLSNTQWKMLVMIGKSNDYNLIDVDLFFVMIEALAKSTINRLRKKFK